MNSLYEALLDPRDETRRQACIRISKLKTIDDSATFPKMFNQIKKMVENDSLSVRFFARKALDQLRVLARAENVDVEALTTIQVEEEFLSEQLLSELNGPDKACRVNALYRIKSTSRDPGMIEKLELFAEEFPEDEAVLAVEAIESITLRLSKRAGVQPSGSGEDKMLHGSRDLHRPSSGHKHTSSGHKHPSSGQQHIAPEYQRSPHAGVSRGEARNSAATPNFPGRPTSKRWATHPEDADYENRLFRIIIILTIIGIIVWAAYTYILAAESPASGQEVSVSNPVAVDTVESSHDILKRDVIRYLFLFSGRNWSGIYEDFLENRVSESADDWIMAREQKYGDKTFQMLLDNISIVSESEAIVSIILLREIEEDQIEEIPFIQSWSFENGNWIPGNPENQLTE